VSGAAAVQRGLSQPGDPGVLWLAGHELRLAWRDWRAMVTAGNRRRFSTALVVLAVVGLALHIPAYAIVARFGEDGLDPGKSELISVSLIVLLYISLLLSQAMESVTRSLYSRGDLDLVLSSPVPPRRLFAVRIGANATLIAIMAVVLTAPFVNVLVATGGTRWLAGYGVAVAFGFAMAAIAVAITITLFRLLGPRRTRLIAQIIAAVVGASFAIGIQVAAILFYSDLASGIFSTPEVLARVLPDEGSPLWLPARAILGDWLALAGVAIAAAAVVALVTAAVAPRLGEYSVAATDLAAPSGRRRRHASRFATHSPARAMRRKEWALLRRDPWLVSQTLTQLLYLLPPALLLARNFGNSTGVIVVVVMVLVTVGGQLAGALAWLAISGEDAPELVATAPVSPGSVTRAKVEAVFGAVAMVLGPVVVAFALLSVWHAFAAALGIAVAAASTIRIQLWFRAQAKRNHFRRRHTSSRIATFGEALVSFSWAAAAGLAAAGSIFAAFSAVVAILILLMVRAVSPRKAAEAT
jgi:ABC-2 type transport system permease protein